MKTWRVIRFLLVLLMLGAMAWFGVTGGPRDWRSAVTPGQKVAAITQLLHGVTAVLAVILLCARSAWLRPVTLVWALAATATATLAPVVWGGTTWVTGALTGLAALALTGLTWWGAMAHSRT